MLKILAVCALMYFPSLIFILMTNDTPETPKDWASALVAAACIVLIAFCVCAAVRVIIS